jgi:hypothetical protein
MKSNILVGVSSALCLGVLPLAAQDTTELEQLKKQLQDLQKRFEQTLNDQRQQIDRLEKQIDNLQKQQTIVTNAAPAPAPAPAPEPAPAAWSPTDPIRVGSKNAYMDIGLVATFAGGGSTAKDIEGGTQLGGHDPNQRGFTVQGVEANFNGAVDPYFRGNANIVYSIDSGGESFMELEEGWLETTSLPGNLKVRAGQLFSEFGRLNSTHPHTWDFVDSPLVSGRFLGPDGLRNPGAWISWLTPLPFYTELLVGVQDSQGGTAASFRNNSDAALPFAYRLTDNDRGLQGFSDLLVTPRLTTSFDLTDNQVLLLGASAALGPNSIGGAGSGDTRTEIYGVDATWKWKSPKQHGGFPFVKWQSEVLWRRTGVGAFNWDLNGDGLLSPGEIEDRATGLPAVLGGETLSDFGFYTQLVYGFHKGWTAGVRYDWLDREAGDYESRSLALDGAPLGPDPLRNRRWRISPNLTFYPSEFSKIRLQYDYDDRADIGADHSVWLQFEFILGAHAAHKF